MVDHVPSQEEFLAVSALPGADRYSHFVKRAADFACVWSLKSVEGWVTVGDEAGRSLLPVWPHAKYAEACAVDGWSANTAQAIEVHRFLDRWLPRMAKDGLSVAVFPTASLQGVVVEPLRLEADLRNELARIE